MPRSGKGCTKPGPCLLHECLPCSAFLGCPMGKDVTPIDNDMQVAQGAQVSEALSVQFTLPEVGLSTPNTAAINIWHPEADWVQQPLRKQQSRHPPCIHPWDSLNPPSLTKPIPQSSAISRQLCSLRTRDSIVLETENRKAEGSHTSLAGACPLISLSLSF